VARFLTPAIILRGPAAAVLYVALICLVFPPVSLGSSLERWFLLDPVGCLALLALFSAAQRYGRGRVGRWTGWSSSTHQPRSATGWRSTR
jgi:hypothetical protein